MPHVHYLLHVAPWGPFLTHLASLNVPLMASICNEFLDHKSLWFFYLPLGSRWEGYICLMALGIEITEMSSIIGKGSSTRIGSLTPIGRLMASSFSSSSDSYA